MDCILWIVPPVLSTVTAITVTVVRLGLKLVNKSRESENSRTTPEQRSLTTPTNAKGFNGSCSSTTL